MIEKIHNYLNLCSAIISLWSATTNYLCLKIIMSKNLTIHEGLYHNHQAQKLPQFVDLLPDDINKHVGTYDITPENAEVIFETDPNNTAEEFKDIPKNIDPETTVPFLYREKTQRTSRKNLKLAKALKGSFHQLKRYREYK